MQNNFPTLPAGWEWKKLSDIADLIGGGTPKTEIKDYWNGNIVWLSPTDLGEVGSIQKVNNSAKKISQLGLEKSSAKLLPIGTVLFSSRASIGKIGIAEIELSTNQGFANFICKPSIYNYYLAYAFKYFRQNIEDLSNSTTFKEVSKGSLKEFQIPLPPLQEQKRLVSILDTLFAKIDRSLKLLDENIAAADALLPSALNTVFGELGEKWETKTIEDVVQIIDGDRGNNYPKKDEFFDDEFCLFLNAKNVTKNGFVFKTNQFITKEKDALLRKGRLEKNDLVLTTRGTIGNVAIFDDSVPYEIMRLNSGMVILRIFNQIITHRFLYVFLNSPSFENFLNEIQSGSAQPQISIKSLKSLQIPIPPLDIQTETVAYLDSVRDKVEMLKKVQNDKKSRLIALKASILDRPFKGEL